MTKRLRASILVLFLILFVVGVIAVIRIASNQKSKKVNVQASLNNKIANLPSELKRVPIYPNSKFKYRFDSITPFDCSNHLCIKDHYSFVTKDNVGQVLSWYQTVPNWKLNNRVEDSYNETFSGTMNIDNSNTNVRVSSVTDFTLQDEVGISYSIFKKVFDWPSASEAELRDWLEFKDPNGLFSYRYPKDLNKPLYIEVFENNKSKSIKDIAKEKENNFGIIVDDKPAFFKDLDIAIVAGIPGVGSSGPNVYILRNNQVVAIQTQLPDTEMLSKILSTFRFLR